MNRSVHVKPNYLYNHHHTLRYTTTMTKQPRKNLLIETAFNLFNEHGYHATGIDRILEESGVSKATLYKHFRSKDDLILAVLEKRHEELLTHLQEQIHQAVTKENSQPVLALFDALTDWFKSDAFQGCNFIKACGEFSQTDDPIREYAAWHKTTILQLISDNLSKGISLNLRKELAQQLLLLIDGAIIAAQTRGEKQAANQAKQIATALIQQAEAA